MQLCIPSGYTLRIASDFCSWTYSPQTTTRILLIFEWDSSELRNSPMRKNGRMEGWKGGRMEGWKKWKIGGMEDWAIRDGRFSEPAAEKALIWECGCEGDRYPPSPKRPSTFRWEFGRLHSSILPPFQPPIPPFL